MVLVRGSPVVDRRGGRVAGGDHGVRGGCAQVAGGSGETAQLLGTRVSNANFNVDSWQTTAEVCHELRLYLKLNGGSASWCGRSDGRGNAGTCSASECQLSLSFINGGSENRFP